MTAEVIKVIGVYIIIPLGFISVILYIFHLAAKDTK